VLLYEEEDLQHLLTSIEANNRDYDHVLRVENGETDIFKKCRFVQVESGTLPVDSNGVADLPLYFPMNIKYKERRYNNLRVVERADMKFRAHAYMEYSRGGLRREDVGVVSIKCKRETA
ncbi:MAG: phage capsid protein, partial [Pseudomonadota bacterium]